MVTVRTPHVTGLVYLRTTVNRPFEKWKVTATFKLHLNCVCCTTREYTPLRYLH